MRDGHSALASDLPVGIVRAATLRSAPFTMDYFRPGLREIRRVVERCNHRLRLLWLDRQLGKAETELGVLGWQQADYDEATQTEVNKIHDVEREQSRMTNAGAEVGQIIRELAQQRETARGEADARRQTVETARQRVQEPLAALEKQIAILRKSEHDYGRRVPELDREQREVETLYSKLLLADSPTPTARDELFRLRERLIGIPNEKADLRVHHTRNAADLQTKEKEAALLKGQIEEFNRQIREIDTSARAAEAKLAGELREREKEKARINAEVDKLERGKTNPFREIGRVLADNNLPPLNQPHVLEHVKALRFAVEERRYELAASREQSAQEDPTAVRSSLALWAVILLAVGLLAAAQL